MRWLPLALLLASTTAEAGARRYALVIGANQGAPTDGPLLYAEADAERMMDVITRAGGVLEEDAVLLRGPSADRVGDALGRLRDRITADRAAGRADEVMVFFYYSGHGDSTSLHLGRSELSLSGLQRDLDGLGADLRVLVVDACRSGELTRVKGAAPAQPFDLQLADELSSRGTAIITSSSSGEDAQESDRLEGGVFTHHFVAGLLGAADLSGEGDITLNEAYHYGYSQTIRTTSKAPFLQHPTYRFDLAGKEDLVLTRVRPERGGVLELAETGEYVILGPRGELVAEVRVDAGARLALPAGRYTVRYRAGTEVREGEVALDATEVVQIHAAELEALPQGYVVRKGLSSERRATGLVVGGGVLGEVVPGIGLGGLGVLGMRVDTPAAVVFPRVRYGIHVHDNGDLVMTQQLFGLQAAAFHLFDIGPLAAGPGLSAGVDGVRQVFDTYGEASPKHALVPHTGTGLRTELALGGRVAIGLEAGAAFSWLRVDDNPTTQVTPHAALDLSLYR